MMCVENVADRETEPLPDEIGVGKRISNRCEARGLIVRPIGHLNVMSPPLILTTAQIDELVAILRESIMLTADELTREGQCIFNADRNGIFLIQPIPPAIVRENRFADLRTLLP
jgi:hypothetical protein